MPAVTALVLLQFAVDRGTEYSVVSTGKREMAVMPAGTAVLLHNSAVDTGTDFSVISTG